jgi:hypothetical protein
MTTTETETREIEAIDLNDLVNPYEELDDPNHRTHIINPAMNLDIQHKFGRMETAQEIVDTPRAFGLEVIALCGFKLIPVHNPEKYDACEACIKIAGDIMRSEG